MKWFKKWGESLFAARRISEREKQPAEKESMIRGIRDLSETSAKEVMVSRTDVVFIRDRFARKDMERMLESGYSRFPVYRKTSDNVVGILYMKDLFRAFIERIKAAGDRLGDKNHELRELLERHKEMMKKFRYGLIPMPGEFQRVFLSGERLIWDGDRTGEEEEDKRPEKWDITGICRKPFFVPESLKLDKLLQEFLRKHVHIAVVVDEYGGVSGIVCLEDIIEEIVGEIQDEFDNEEEEIKQLEAGVYLCDGRVHVSTLNEELGLSLEEENIDTLGGLVFSLFEKIPARYEKVSYENLDFIVQKIEGHKIEQVKIVIHDVSEEA